MDDFQSQCEAFCAQLENELGEGSLAFPTVFDLSLRIKALADDPDSTLEAIARVVKAEPVLSVKTVRMANALLLNPYRAEVRSVADAVPRLGLSTLRCLAYAVAAEQLARDQRSRQMQLIASGLWMHSIEVASWAYAFARQLRTLNPDIALLGGLMTNIGQFYLLAKASAYPALEHDLGRFAGLIASWSGPIGQAVLEAFDAPADLLDACNAQPGPEGRWPPATLADVVVLARLAAETPNPFDGLLGIQRRPQLLEACTGHIDQGEFAALVDAARATRQEILTAVCG